MANPSDKVVVKWVNDTRARVCWVILASLCLCGFTQLMEVFKDESQVIYKYVGMSLVSLYVILLVKSLCSDETPTIAYRSGSCLRSFVPLVIFFIIFITIYYHRTLGVSILTLSILFGVVALMQLLFPIDEFCVGYVMVIITLGISIACSVVDYDLEEVMPFGFIFSYIFLCEMIIGVINYPGNHRFFNSY
ncbi:PREDICTED: uncharacterized protein LOC106293964 [Brassica oleracea var. oleracea]|uniref:Uncharacterized protein n=1 Tax=Brassica oleracea var. oleracea TaxID=109376 RepID=A0A0D3CI84_BRAOL|nr:PREDICTED: uncharacterized protein LOC106293964 [Brassica oleracea var. oleracea]